MRFAVPPKEGGKFAAGLRKAWEKRAWHGPQAAHDSSHDVQAQLARQAESDTSVRLGLAAFAIAAYIKMVLCPALSNYIPRSGSGMSATHSVSPHVTARRLLATYLHTMDQKRRLLESSECNSDKAALERVPPNSTCVGIHRNISCKRDLPIGRKQGVLENPCFPSRGKLTLIYESTRGTT